MPSSREEDLTAGDWVAVVLTGLCVLFCFQWAFFMGPAFAKMFADFGSTPPALTELSLTVWFPLMLGLNPASVAFYAVSQRGAGLQRRRFFLVVSFVMGLAAAGLLLVGAYLPIFTLAGSVKSGN